MGRLAAPMKGTAEGRDEPVEKPLTAVEIVQQWASRIEIAAGHGWRLDINRQPPYGWLLHDPEGEVRESGSLDHVVSWLIRNSGVNPTDIACQPDQDG